MKSAQCLTRAVWQEKGASPLSWEQQTLHGKKPHVNRVRLLGKPLLLAEEQNQEPSCHSLRVCNKHMDLHLLICIVNLSWICRLSVYVFLWKAIILSLRINNLGSFPVDLNCLFFVRRSLPFGGNQSWPQYPQANLLRGVLCQADQLYPQWLLVIY